VTNTIYDQKYDHSDCRPRGFHLFPFLFGLRENILPLPHQFAVISDCLITTATAFIAVSSDL
jgi:hypothetical protein